MFNGQFVSFLPCDAYWCHWAGLLMLYINDVHLHCFDFCRLLCDCIVLDHCVQYCGCFFTAEHVTSYGINLQCIVAGAVYCGWLLVKDIQPHWLPHGGFSHSVVMYSMVRPLLC